MAVYYRVSTKKQARGHSIDAQETALKKFFVEQKWPWPDPRHIFVDHESGRHDTRAGFMAMMDCVRNGEIAGFAVHMWDRFFRDLFKSLTAYNELKTLHAQAWSADDPYDIFSFDGEGRFKEDMLAAEGYSRKLSKHIRKGKRTKAESGETNASRIAFGWARNPATGQITQTPDAALVERAARLYLTGQYSGEQIARNISTPDHRFTFSQVLDWLANPFIAGRITYSPVIFGRTDTARRCQNIIQGHHEGVITWEEFEQIQTIMRKRSRGGRGVHWHARTYVYGRSLLRCAGCGRIIVGYPERDAHLYICGAKRLSVGCPSGVSTIDESTIDAEIERIIQHIHVPNNWIEQATQRAVQISTRDDTQSAERADIDMQRREAMDAFMAHRITSSEFARRIEDLDANASRVISRHTIIAQERIADMVNALHDMKRLWSVGDPVQRSTLLRSLFATITVDTRAKLITTFTALNTEIASVLRGCSGLIETTSSVFSRIPDWRMTAIPLREAAQRAGVSKQTMLSWCRTGKVTAEKRGNRWWVSKPT